MIYEQTGCCPQGWQCPICKRVYSPTTFMCYYRGGNIKPNVITNIGTGTGDVKIDWTKQTTITGTNVPEVHLGG